MKKAIAVLVTMFATTGLTHAEEKMNTCYELRIYTAAPGKFDDLHARFRNHTCKLFEKHGMTNVGYWTPTDEPDHRLVYVLSYPDRKSRDKSWAMFMTDPEWLAVWKASEKEGKLTSKIESTILHATDYSPAIAPKIAEKERIFELRTYTSTPGNLDRLSARFRNHTLGLFSKHGMEHVGYWVPDEDQKAHEVTLIYLLAHESKESRDASFKAFGGDPEWKKVRENSEKEAGSSLTAKDGVQSLMLKPTDYSPTK